MPADSSLKRDLGLLSTTAIATGAMVGSGIFILPAVAYQDAGPAAVIAFGIAGVLVAPAAISAAEMATAMPEDGGAYLYVERGMGPLLGTVAGIGTWLMLSLKSSLALVGGVPYLVLVAPVLAEYVVLVAIALALFFTVVNAVSAKGSGSLQFVIVGVMLLVMAVFIVGGTTGIDPAGTRGAFDPTADGLLAAIGAVFVSYAGVTKVTAVAEEVANPGRNLPLAMIGSLAVVTVLYMTVVYVAIGVADTTPGAASPTFGAEFVAAAGEDTAPIAHAADIVFGPVGVYAVIAAALLALASTANAGLLAASRFPLAMARDGLVPPQFETVNDRFATPVNAIALTGGSMILIVSVFDVGQVARFGSAFQILVFVLLNVALIGFREGAIEEYEPKFVSPLYPWLQLFGIASGLVVLVEMGGIPFLGAMGIAALSVVWYLGYARPRIDREGAARTGARESATEAALERTREVFDTDRRHDVLVSVTGETSQQARTDMVRMATDLSRLRTGSVMVASFDTVPHRTFTRSGPTVRSRTPPEWLQFGEEPPDWLDDAAVRPSGGQPIAEPISETGTALRYREIETEDVGRAIVEFAEFEGFDLIVLERRSEELHDWPTGGVTTHVLRNASAGVLLVEDRGFEGANEIAVAASNGPYDPLKLLVADAIAEETGAEISLLQSIPEDAPESRRQTIEDYHTELLRMLTVSARSRVIETDDRVAGLSRFAASADLLVTGTESRGLWGALTGRTGDSLVEAVDCTAVMVQPAETQRPGLVQRFVLDPLFD